MIQLRPGTRSLRDLIVPSLFLAVTACSSVSTVDAGGADAAGDAANTHDTGAVTDAPIPDAASQPDVVGDSATRDASDSDAAGTDAGNVDAGSNDASPIVTGCATAPIIQGDSASTVSAWSRVTGMLQLNYYGDGYKTVDMTRFETIWSNPMGTIQLWPGQFGIAPTIPMPVNQYVSAVFTVPSPYFNGPRAPNPLYGEYFIGETDASARISMTISQHCGDFGQLSPTTIVPGCVLNMGGADSFLAWSGSGSCVLHDGQTYYLNIINADISQLASTGKAVSTQDDRCIGNVCTDPIENGPGTWSGYAP